MVNISVVVANIAEQKTDAIVNAANTSLFGGAGVAGAIFDTAGYDEMTAACQAIGHCETGGAVITPGFNLSAKFVIHAVGPVYGQNKGEDAELLKSCYWRSLQIADDNEISSVSFPLISTGVYGYPKLEAAQLAIDTVKEYFLATPNSGIDEVIFCAFKEDDKILLESVLENDSSKAEGMLVGLAVGDALGAPVEFGYSSDDIRREWNAQMQDHRIPKGFYTDDTAMALCLADSLIECDGYDSYSVMDKYSKWVSEGYRDSEGIPASDVGSQTKGAIDAYLNEPVIYADTVRGYGAGNGGIMRIAPAIIATAHTSIEQAITLAKFSSRETHYSEEADAGAEVFGAMLWNALHLNNKEDVVDIAKYSSGESFDDILLRVNQTKALDNEVVLRDLGGYVVDAIKIAVWGFLNFESFKSGMVSVIKLGGDTDTNAAIYGQLAGAYYGYEAIPKEWLDDLYKKKEISELANTLFTNAPYSILRTRFEEDSRYFKSFER